MEQVFGRQVRAHRDNKFSKTEKNVMNTPLGMGVGELFRVAFCLSLISFGIVMYIYYEFVEGKGGNDDLGRGGGGEDIPVDPDEPVPSELLEDFLVNEQNKIMN